MKISDRAEAIAAPNGRHHFCHVPGCVRLAQRYASNGLSELYCKVHIEYHRRHGSYWHRSYMASELSPFRVGARLWLRKHKRDHRLQLATSAIELLLARAGPVESAYDLRGLPGAEKARIALARLREAKVPATRILEVVIAVVALIADRGPLDSEFRDVQIAKAVHRMASGTHRSTSGYPMPSKYAPSTGRVLRVLGHRLWDGLGLVLDNATISEVIELAHPALAAFNEADRERRRAEDAIAREMLRVADFGMGPQRLKQYRSQLRRQFGLRSSR